MLYYIFLGFKINLNIPNNIERLTYGRYRSANLSHILEKQNKESLSYQTVQSHENVLLRTAMLRASNQTSVFGTEFRRKNPLLLHISVTQPNNRPFVILAY